MKCPHCTIDFHAHETIVYIDSDPDGYWAVGASHCSACSKIVIRLISADQYYHASNQLGTELTSRLVRPRVAGRPPVPRDVPEKYREDYDEACLVLPDSAKASAALSRRCLQLILRDEAKVKPRDLSQEIQELLDRHTLPSHIEESLDAVRNIGNFAAHPIKSKSTGEIVPVEPGEAEWNLDVVESLFDFYFVAPARTRERREALTLIFFIRNFCAGGCYRRAIPLPECRMIRHNSRLAAY
jgi:hypothetical protein